MAKSATKAAPKGEHQAKAAAQRNAENGPRKGAVVAAGGQLIPEANVPQTEAGEGGVQDPVQVSSAGGQQLPAPDGVVVGATARVGDVPPRAEGSGFRKEARTVAAPVAEDVALKDMALAEEHAPDTIYLPNQTVLPTDGPAVVNIPYGSEPRNLDTKTGAMTYQARQRNDEAEAASGRDVEE